MPEFVEGPEPEGSVTDGTLVVWDGTSGRLIREDSEAKGLTLIFRSQSKVAGAASGVYLVADDNESITRAELYAEQNSTSGRVVANVKDKSTPYFVQILGSGGASSFPQLVGEPQRRQIVYGAVGAEGEAITGGGYTSVKTAKGTYKVSFATALTSVPVVTANDSQGTLRAASISAQTANGFTVKMANNLVLEDIGFSFIAIG